MMRAVRRTALLAALILSLGLAGCGGSDDGGSATPTEPAVETSTDTESTSETADGQEVFASAGCAGCHTLSAAGAAGTIGPSLDETEFTTEQIADQVTNGGGAMPAFEDDLTPEQIQAVAEYVFAVAGT